MILWSTG